MLMAVWLLLWLGGRGCVAAALARGRGQDEAVWLWWGRRLLMAVLLLLWLVYEVVDGCVAVAGEEEEVVLLLLWLEGGAGRGC